MMDDFMSLRRRAAGAPDAAPVLTAAQWRREGLKDHKFVQIGQDALNDSGNTEWWHSFSTPSVLRSLQTAIESGHVIVTQKRVSETDYPRFIRLALLVPERCPN